MQIKRYEAASVQEALANVRKDLGQDAVILSTKKLKRGNTPLVEVTAARDFGGKTLQAPGAAAPRKGFGQGPSPAETGSGPASSLKAEIDDIRKMLSEFRTENSLRKDLAELKETVNTLFDFLGLVKTERGCFSFFYHHLIARGISRERAYRLMERIKDEFAEGEGKEKEVLDRLEDLIKNSLHVPERKRSEKRALAFVGPTGVGKTTTLAKLAAYYALEEKKKVGLITTDTYRIAAAEQLKVYAKIMGLPIEVAAEKDALKKALHKFADRDLILIDTPGRSQSDEPYIRKMGEMLNQGIPVSTHLLLSLTASRENLLDAALKFSPVSYETLIFTKIDETESCGLMFDIIDQVRKPVSYITNGQNVPKDIIKTTPGRIARLIMGNQANQLN